MNLNDSTVNDASIEWIPFRRTLLYNGLRKTIAGLTIPLTNAKKFWMICFMCMLKYGVKIKIVEWDHYEWQFVKILCTSTHTHIPYYSICQLYLVKTHKVLICNHNIWKLFKFIATTKEYITRTLCTEIMMWP